MLHRRRDNNARSLAAEEERASITMIALMTAAKRKGCPFLYSTQWQARREVQISDAGLDAKLFGANCKIEVLSNHSINDSKPFRVRK